MTPTKLRRSPYDAWNRFKTVKNDAGTVLATYEYDGLNRRIEKHTTATAPGGARDVHSFFNEQWQLLESRTTAGGVTAVDQFVNDISYIDATVCRFHDANADGDLQDANDTIRYYTWDANFNVTAAFDGTYSAGQFVFPSTPAERYVYATYGEATVYTATWTNPTAPTANGPLFAGYWFDAETGLYNDRNRPYHSTLAVFPVRDPVEADPNTYRYCGNGPTYAVDPFGLWGTDVHIDMTTELAEWAGIDCATDIGEATNKPDEDESNPQKVFVKVPILNNARADILAGKATGVGDPETAVKEIKKEVDRLCGLTREYHFPVSGDGEVHGGSLEARAKAEAAVLKPGVSIATLGKALHVLQDSWSHQGKPVFNGSYGHGRGVKVIPAKYKYEDTGPLVHFGPHGGFGPLPGITRKQILVAPERYELINGGVGAAASLSPDGETPTADNPLYWPEDVVAAAMATYQYLKKYKAINTLKSTHDPLSDKEVLSKLKAEFRGVHGDGKNAVEWPPPPPPPPPPPAPRPSRPWGGKFIPGQLCFEAGTLVGTPEGTRPIEQLKSGDRVLAFSLAEQAVVETRVHECHSGLVNEIYELRVGGEVLRVTGGHPFFVVDKGWTRVVDLNKGDLFLTSDKQQIELCDIVWVNCSVRVYNLSVHGEENYFVGASQVLAHNKPP